MIAVGAHKNTYLKFLFSGALTGLEKKAASSTSIKDGNKAPFSLDKTANTVQTPTPIIIKT